MRSICEEPWGCVPPCLHIKLSYNCPSPGLIGYIILVPTGRQSVSISVFARYSPASFTWGNWVGIPRSLCLHPKCRPVNCSQKLWPTAVSSACRGMRYWRPSRDVNNISRDLLCMRLKPVQATSCFIFVPKAALLKKKKQKTKKLAIKNNVFAYAWDWRCKLCCPLPPPPLLWLSLSLCLQRKHQAMYDDFVKRKDMKKEGYSAASLHGFSSGGANSRYPVAEGPEGGGLTKFVRHDPRQVCVVVESSIVKQ